MQPNNLQPWVEGKQNRVGICLYICVHGHAYLVDCGMLKKFKAQ